MKVQKQNKYKETQVKVENDNKRYDLVFSNEKIKETTEMKWEKRR